MKKMLISLGLISFIGFCNANNSSKYIKANIIIQNIHGSLQAGTWFNFILKDNIIPSVNTAITNTNASIGQHFIATLADPIYNHDFSELLIPQGAVAHGTYHNNGNSCSFTIEEIDYKDNEIELQPGAYNTISASLPNQAECNPHITYGIGQLLEFQTKVNINDLTPVEYNNDYTVLFTQDNFVQTYGNSDYAITAITKYSNGLMQISVKFYDAAIRSKLVPVFYDDFELPHVMNSTFVTRNDEPDESYKNIYSYLVIGSHKKFGLGILEQ